MSENGAQAQPQPTSGLAWRKPREEGYVVKLEPSGHYVRMRPAALDVLIASGKIPDLLTPAAADALWGDRLLNSAEVKGLLAEAKAAKDFTSLVNLVVRASVMEPRIVDNPQADDEISLEDIEFPDKLLIYQLAIQPVTVLNSFRDRQIADVEALPDGEDAQPSPQPVDGDS